MVNKLILLVLTQVVLASSYHTSMPDYPGFMKFFGELNEDPNNEPSDPDLVIKVEVCSIKPQGNGTRTFHRYRKPKEQEDCDAMWQTLGGITTFEDCAAEAEKRGYNMFLFEEGLCNVTMKCYKPEKRICPEIIEQVYIAEHEGNYCTDECWKYKEGHVLKTEPLGGCSSLTIRTVCDGTGHWVEEYVDVNGNVLPGDLLVFPMGSACCYLTPIEYDHAAQAQVCNRSGAVPCAPRRNNERASFLNSILGFRNSTQVDFMLDLLHDGTNWDWTSTGVNQPAGAIGWDSGYPVSPNPYGWMNEDGYYNRDVGMGKICCIWW